MRSLRFDARDFSRRNEHRRNLAVDTHEVEGQRPHMGFDAGERSGEPRTIMQIHGDLMVEVWDDFFIGHAKRLSARRPYERPVQTVGEAFDESKKEP